MQIPTTTVPFFGTSHDMNTDTQQVKSYSGFQPPDDLCLPGRREVGGTR